MNSNTDWILDMQTTGNELLRVCRQLRSGGLAEIGRSTVNSMIRCHHGRVRKLTWPGCKRCGHDAWRSDVLDLIRSAFMESFANVRILGTEGFTSYSLTTKLDAG